MGDLIGVPLDLDDFEVVCSDVVEGVLEVTVRSTFPRGCGHCGSVAVVVHSRHRRRLRDRACSRPTVLIWEQRRWACSDCGRTSRERHPAIPARRGLTHRFRRALFDSACRRPFIDVARDEAVTHYRVVEAFDAHAPAAVGELRAARVLALDESSFRRPFRFMTVLFAPEEGRALEMCGGRDQRAAEFLFSLLSEHERARIDTVVTDCHWPFRKAVEARLPGVRLVADKFHVLRSIDTAADRVRRRHGHKPNWRGRDGGTARQHNPRNDPRIYGARWVFARRAAALGPGQWDQLLDLFAARPAVGVAWLMKEAFAAVYAAPDRAEAARRLEVWEHNLIAADMPELSAAWRTLQWWREPILAYFEDRQTNGFAEGVTNKIKVMKRSAYGFRNPQRYRLKVLLICQRST
jgi:transposase